MGLTTAIFTSLSGMSSNSESISVTGNNIANVNTTGFKASRLSFETQISKNLHSGTAPTATLGGTNPSQVGMGTRVSAVTRNFTSGSLQVTGLNTDLAIEGNGFFVLGLDGTARYTRDGSFSLDKDSNLVSAGGGLVQGYGIDSDFNVVEGVTKNINIPIGDLTLAEATKTVTFSGNLDTRGDLATMGALITSGPIYTDDAQQTLALATDTLTSIFGDTGAALFADGDVITLSGALKGGSTLPDHTFEVGAANTTGSNMSGTTLEDFMGFLEDALGINTSVGGGATLSATGELTIEGNTGLSNNLEVQASNIIVNKSTSPRLPFELTQQAIARGESVRTAFVAFDSLGAAMVIDMHMVLEAKPATGTQWRFYLESEEDTGLDRVLGTGTVEFDNVGQIISVTNPEFMIDRSGTGAFSPQQLTIDFEDSVGGVTAFAAPSQLSVISQDGSGVGTLEDFTVLEDGTVVGVFSNSLQRNLSRIALAQFSNPNGLEEVGGNLYRVTDSSGTAMVGHPGIGGLGQIMSGTLELSNVELSQEFISLIAASTGFTANSRVMTTSDRLIQELLSAVR